MLSEHLPPPIYSQDVVRSSASPTPESMQVLIIPATDTINFQKGYVGADDERAAIEGELQIKGTEPAQWSKITMELRAVETAYRREIELASTELVLFSASEYPSEADIPSSFPFAIPLTQDSPQCIHTPQSSLSHTLTAVLYPTNRLQPPLTKTITVHTRRFSSHSSVQMIAPETYTLDTPTRVEVEVPRTTFKAGESVPIYVTVPPPNRDLVVEQGIRLRNIRAELVRVVKVKRDEGEDASSESEIEWPPEELDDPCEGPSTATTSAEKQFAATSSSKGPMSPLFRGSSYKTVISHSGASCRFHSSRPIRLRFVLQQATPSGTPSEMQMNLPNSDRGHLDSDTECASITQTTLLHSVTFRINVHVSFVDMSSRTEHLHTVSIPVNIVAPPAPLPEVEEWVDAAYQKKHDRPPTRTVRYDDMEVSAPHYEEGQAGPSYQHSGAPPPFEERDAPPPFFSEPTASSSGRLPTFLESEAEIFMPNSDNHNATPPRHVPTATIGEGVQFGFSASEQFDGHTEDMQRSLTPPPTLEMATRDANVTGLAGLHEPERAMEALGLALEQHEEAAGRGEMPPPPPPAMDDPSDPPPSIDSDFRMPQPQASSHAPPQASPPSFGQAVVNSASLSSSPPPSAPGQEHPPSHGHAPPPYLVPENDGDQTSVTRPPPYVDLIPGNTP